MSDAKSKLMGWLVKEKETGLQDVKFFVTNEAKEMSPCTLSDQINRFHAAQTSNDDKWKKALEQKQALSLLA